MAYEVGFLVPERPLGLRAIEFKVREDQVMLGTLKVNKGGVVWVRGGFKHGYRFTWSAFNDVATKQKRRKN